MDAEALTERRTRTVNGKPRTDTYVYVACPRCGALRWLRLDVARKGSVCYRCAQTAKAQRGDAAMAARYGQKWALRHVRAYRLAHPSPLEREVERLLARLGVPYEREVELRTKAHGRRQRAYLIDFMVAGVAIEVNGGVHGLPAKRLADRRKKALLTRRGIPLLVLTEAEIRGGAAWARLSAVVLSQAA